MCLPRPIRPTPRHWLIDNIKSSIHRPLHDRRCCRSEPPVLIFFVMAAGRGGNARPAQISFTVKMHGFRVESMLLCHTAGPFVRTKSRAKRCRSADSLPGLALTRERWFWRALRHRIGCFRPWRQRFSRFC